MLIVIILLLFLLRVVLRYVLMLFDLMFLVDRYQARAPSSADKSVARASRSHHRSMTEPSRHLRGGPSRASNIDGFDDDDDDGGLVDLCDDERGDVASYVYPSNKRSGGGGSIGGGARRYGRQHSAPSASTAGYDTVDAAGVQRGAARSDAYEKVSSCRYVHIWQMPLPKAPDE